jgi:quinol monooxygenase YgiN
MASILARLRVKPGAENLFEDLVRGAHVATHEQEPGLLRYEFWRAPQPSTYLALESFRDIAAFVAHQRSDHHRAAAPALRAVLDQTELYWLDPVPGTTDIGPTLGTAPSTALPLWWADLRGSV